MFDLIAGNARHGFHDPTATPTIISVVAHALIVLAIVVLPVLRATQVLPPVVPTVMAFVAAPATAPPPPPPPPPPPAPAAAAHPSPQPIPSAGKLAAPIDAPLEVRPESAIDAREGTAGVVGGVEGGVPGGVVGGIVGGIVSAVAPPPPPPPPPPPTPPPAHAEPVRIGGIITAPALLHRVEPVYPNIAVTAKLGGVVILEATVGTDGCVESVRVLRSRGFLEAAAIEALKQWRYSPLILDGVPVSFVLTVTFSFSVQ